MVKKRTIISMAIILFILAGTFFAWKLFYHRPEELLSQLEDGEAPQGRVEEATLTFNFGGLTPQAPQEVLDQVERKLKNSLNIKLKFIVNDTPVGNEQKDSSSTRPLWDVLYFDAFHSTRGLKTLVKPGGLKDITEEFQRLAPHYYRCFSPEELKTVMVDGKTYAIPQHSYTTQMVCAIVREDLMSKYQIPAIKNYSDYEEYLRIIKAKEPGLLPVIFNNNSVGLFAEAYGYVILSNQLGLVYEWDDPDPKILAWEQTPAFRKGIDTLSRWYNNGYLLKNVGAAKIDEKMVGSGKWASFIAPFATELYYNEILKSRNIPWRYKAYPLNSGHSSARSLPTGMLLINPQSKNMERIFRFINWLYAKQENYDLLMYGIKGKHYTLEGDFIKLPEGEGFQKSPYAWVWHEALQNIDFERIPRSSPVGSVKEYREFLEANTKYPPLMGFNPNLGSVQTITPLRQIFSDDIENTIYKGYFNPDDVDKYIRDQKQAGIDQLLVEVQRQLDQWKATYKTELTANERE